MNNSFSAGAEYDFGTVIFTEQEIIDYALLNDPLAFHTHKEIAQNHLFKDIVASGQQAFHHFYVNHWIPTFGGTVLCGLSVDNWKFLKPMYAGKTVHCRLQIIKVIKHPEKGTVSITWLFQFNSPEGIHYQHLEMSVLHRIQ